MFSWLFTVVIQRISATLDADSVIQSASKVAEILWMTTVESHENTKIVLYYIYGATTPVGLPDACLQDLLLGLSRSCSNTNCHVYKRDIMQSDNGTELMSRKCSERRLSMIIQRSLSATAL